MRWIKKGIVGLIPGILFPMIVFASDFPEKLSTGILCGDSELMIAANVICNTDAIYTGTASMLPFNVENIKQLYGQAERWQECSEIEEGMWRYQGEAGDRENYITGFITVVLGDVGLEAGAGLKFDISSLNGSDETIFEEARTDEPEIILELLAIDASVWKQTHASSEIETYYAITGQLSGVPIAWRSPVYAKGTMCYHQGRLSLFDYTGRYEIAECDEAQLLAMDKILEHIQEYATLGVIHTPASGDEVIQIELQYYLEQKQNMVTFRPVWVFEVEELIEGMTSPTGGNADFLYVDAQSGELVEYMGS